MTQPEALRLAERIDGWVHQDEMNIEDAMKAAAELRRLHAENAELRGANNAFGQRQEWWNERMFVLEQQRDELLEALERSRAQWIHSVNAEQCLAAIAKAQQ